MARARSLTKKDLEAIDKLAAFFVESDRNAELMEMMVNLMAIANTPGAAAVFAKRRSELLEARRAAA